MDLKALMQVLVESFQKEGIDFALIGGFAMHAAGYTRATQDIDFLVPGEQSTRVRRVMERHGYRLAHESAEASSYEGPVSALARVDFLHARRAHTKGMLKRASIQTIFDGAVQVKVIEPEDVIGLKIQSSSNDPERFHRDAADIETLLRIQRSRLNMKRVGEYFKLFGRTAEFDEMLRKLNHAQS